MAVPPMKNATPFATEAFTLLGVGICVVALRTYSRIGQVGIRKFQPDDYLMLVAACIYTIETTMAYEVSVKWHGIANNAMTETQRAWLISAEDGWEYQSRVSGSKLQVALWLIYTLLLWILKAAMCVFYIRLTDGLDYSRRINFGFIFIICSWITVVFVILLGCFPLHQNWQIYPNPGRHCQPAESRANLFVTLTLNVLTDIYLMTIPIPMVWTARLRPARKAGLILLFSGGLFVMGAGVMRCVEIIYNPATDALQTSSWGCRETFIAIVTTNMPMVVPLLRKWFGPYLTKLGILTSRRAGTYPESPRRPPTGLPDLELGNHTYVVHGRWDGQPSPRFRRNTDGESIQEPAQDTTDDSIQEQSPRMDTPLGGIRKTVTYRVEDEDMLHGSARRGSALGNSTFITAQRSYFQFD
ncbi:uncharacterized protein E0L32_010608 [Thyridium curvatum]|uniref:Rhodopsin domain-containing protein n=1 Tax=Thyridium curvatum TaxID=1093900 RepID=A0A507AG58_9PEZI|nr:uncharacterized protein E0L32_010608 [Thyridium curvatum]TPX07712.1 hypothetical protein E0L32_010608 [Thyridium curvatum]